MTTRNIYITDHCLVRYFERKFGVDIEQIKREILPDNIKKNLTPDCDRYVIDGIDFRLRGDAIVTCMSTKPDDPTKLAKNKPARHRSNDKKKKNEPRQVRKKYSKKSKKGRYG